MSDIETRVQQIAQVLGQLEDTQVPRNIRNSARDAVETVSYTHLTLPTICSV